MIASVRQWSLVSLLALCFAAAPLAAGDYVPPSEMDAATVYGFSCASCHGTGGAGDLRRQGSTA